VKIGQMVEKLNLGDTKTDTAYRALRSLGPIPGGGNKLTDKHANRKNALLIDTSL
jgi:hypothetical protein